MRRLVVTTLACISGVAFADGSSSAACVLGAPTLSIERTERVTLAMWDVPPSMPVLEPVQPADSHPALVAYREWAEAEDVDLDPRALLRGQKVKFVVAFGAAAGKRFDDIIDGRIGTITRIRCLEAALLERHQERFDASASMTEFQAYVLDDAAGRHRVYFLSGPGVSPPVSEGVTRRIDADRKTGWRLRAHLHNHPFLFSNSTGDIAGTTIPSGDKSYGDVEHYLTMARDRGLREAWITNGFDSVSIAAKDFDAL